MMEEDESLLLKYFSQQIANILGYRRCSKTAAASPIHSIPRKWRVAVGGKHHRHLAIIIITFNIIIIVTTIIISIIIIITIISHQFSLDHTSLIDHHCSYLMFLPP